MNNKGYIFQNYFDAMCYLVISSIYPLLTYWVQSNQLGVDITSKLNFIITGLFFSATFFYDYYQRYRDCNEQTLAVVNILFVGRLGFCILTILSFIFLIIVAGNFFSCIQVDGMSLFKKLPFCAVYPFVIALIEIVRRMYYEYKGKISKVRV